MAEVITIKLGKGARTSTLETSGFKGEACKAASEIFKEKLGTINAEENSPEYHEAHACELAHEG